MSAGNGKGDLTNRLVLSENGSIMFELSIRSMHKQELHLIPFQPHYLTMPKKLSWKGWGGKGF